MQLFPALRGRDATAKDVDSINEEIVSFLAEKHGIDPKDVDLDEAVTIDGKYGRRVRRANERYQVRQQRKGQRAFNRKRRQQRRVQEIAEAMARVQSHDTPMGANVRSAIRWHEKAQAKAAEQAAKLVS